MPKCSKCGKKDAIFSQPFSNYIYCAECFYSDLFKRFKRNLSRTRVLSFKGKPVLFVPSNMLAESLLALKMLRSIEKIYSGKITVFFDSLDSQMLAVKHLGKEIGELHYFLDIVPDIKKEIENDSYLGRWRFFRALSAAYAKKLNADALLLPICHDVLAIFDLSSFLATNKEGIGESSLLLQGTEKSVSIVNVFYGISCRETSFLSYYLFPDVYEYQLKIMNWKKSTFELYAERIIADAIRAESGEIIRSVGSSLNWLFKGIESIERCDYCGGTSLRKGACGFCERFLQKCGELIKCANLIELKP